MTCYANMLVCETGVERGSGRRDWTEGGGKEREEGEEREKKEGVVEEGVTFSTADVACRTMVV